MPTILTRRATGLRGAATFAAGRPPSVRGSAVFAALRPTPPLGAAVFVAQRPAADPVTASPLLTYDVDITGLPGDVLSLQYDHTGSAEELEVTVAGLYPMVDPDVRVSLTGYADGVLLGSLAPRAFGGPSQEPQVDHAAGTTTFRFRNGFDSALRGVRLPELIEWKLDPSDHTCVVRRRQNVSALVAQVMQTYVDARWTLEDDPLAGSEWIEGLIDMTTLNLTPQALWDATYGALGLVLHVDVAGADVRLVGRWPYPTRSGSGPAIPLSLRTRHEPRREWYQVPRRLTVRGAPRWTPLTARDLLDMIGPHPDRAALERELLPDNEWFDAPESSGGSTVQRGYRKSHGQVTEQVEVTTGDVTAQEQVDGRAVTKPFYSVATGFKRTTTDYDPECPARPTYQRIETRTWAYQIDTVTSAVSLGGAGLSRVVEAGDEVAREISETTYIYSPQGYLAARVTTTTRTASVTQQGADARPGQRGPVSARDTVTQTITERWWPAGGGQWWYDPGTSGQTLLPLYDEHGEAIRTVSVARATPDAPRLTDQAPPSYDCAPPCDVIRNLLDPSGVTLRAGDAGRAEEETLSVDALAPGGVLRAAQSALAARWRRVVTDFSVPWPLGYLPGAWLSDGRVQALRIRVDLSGNAPEVTADVTCARLDTSFLAPGQAGVEPYQLPTDAGRAVMLARASGGAEARVVTAWDAGTGEPVVERAFITFRSGFPPAPGDELDWTLIRGQREATSGRR